jgi:ABC-2 type transport system ATP-binding protein
MADAMAVHDLRKRYGPIQALAGVSLNVQQGEIFGLLGANGAGKTTLIKALIGLLRPDSGKAEVLGFDPQQDKRALRQQTGYMPQSAVIYEDLSARENIRFLATAHRLPERERHIDEILDFVGLGQRQHDVVYGFSGGMKQRLSLACALVHRPTLLLLDEPTTGVDPKLREAFWRYFRQITDAGATILLSTHQMDEAVYCDRLAIMRDGVVLACDSPKNLMGRGQTTVTIHTDARTETETVYDYADTLPQLLQRHHLAGTVRRIEIEHDTLESVVLGMIDTIGGQS